MYLGEPYVRTQFIVRGKHFTVIAAANPLGFIFYRIFDGPVNDDSFIEFLNLLSINIVPDQFGIIDNASIHRTNQARIKLEEVFNGRYLFCSPYSPHLKPIEKCFKLVKAYITYLELKTIEDYRTPVDLINNAFNCFKIGGIHSGGIMGCWQDYFTLHSNYLNNDL